VDRPPSAPPTATTPILDPERWRALEPILDAALELRPEDRDAFLDEACGDDAALRAELAAMLDECARDDVGLDLPAAERFASLLDERHELAGLRAELAAKYAIQRVLGSGGMGTVYLARDLRHGREVAIKVLAPELAGTANAARFLAEIRLTARLRHPHILPLFDSGIALGRPWYVMPYMEGGTLRDRLERDGVLPLDDAVRVLREIAAALAYAHERGVVHRDVKPDNVLLDVGGALLGDFGIARAIERVTGVHAATTATVLTLAGLGTPMYMAPEQRIPGAAIDHRVDLYALGVIAHEILCGRPPSAGHVSGAAPVAGDPAPRPRTVRLHPDLPAELAPLIARLLAERPEERVQYAEEVLRELDAIGRPAGLPEIGTTGGPVRFAARRRRAALVALAAAGVLALAGATGWALRTRHAASSLSARRVLVVPFENATGDPTLAALGRMAADWVAQGIAQTGAVDVSPEVVPPGAGGDRALRAAARRSGAGTVVSGAYYLDGDSVRLQPRITNVADWTLVRPIAPVAAARAAPQALLEPLRQRVMAALAVTHDPRIERWAAGASPPTFEAYEQLVAGLDLFSAGRWAEALPYWDRAAALDSTFVQPLLHMVFAYMNLGRWAEADSLSALLTRREGLSPFERAMLEYQRGQIAGDLRAVLAGADAMIDAVPGDYLPYYLKAFAALSVNRPREALEAASKISSRAGRFDKPWSSANYWMVVTSAWHALDEHHEELRAAREARGLHPGIREFVWFELRALAALGRAGEVERRVTEFEGLQPTPAGWTHSRLLIELADELEAHGHTSSARAVLLRADRWQRAQGEGGGRGRAALYERAQTLYRLGEDAAADSILARLEAERPGDWRILAGRGLIAIRQGRTGDAQRFAERLRTLRTPYEHGRPAFARAQLAAQSEDVEGALALIRLALAEGMPFGLHLHTTPALVPLRDDPEFQELLRPRG